MTTRLLASFNVLDNHSKKVLDRHARKSRLLSHAPRGSCASFRKPDLPLTVNCDWDFEFPSARRTPISKHKTTTDINEEQELLQNKLRVSKPATAASSTTEDSNCRLKEAVRSRVSVCPFTSPEDLPWRSVCPFSSPEDLPWRSVCPFTSPEDLPWRSVCPFSSPEDLPWRSVCPFSSPEDLPWRSVCPFSSPEDLPWRSVCPFSSPEDLPWRSVCPFSSPEDLPWRIGHRTGGGREGGGGRLKRKSVRGGQRKEVSPVSDDVTADCVPLSLSDELKRKNVRVLTPRPPSVSLPLPIVSETYPVVCNSDPYQHKPFTSSGHHFLEDPNPNLNPSPNPSRTTVHSAIVRITNSLQADIMMKT
ncbi:uncharacterized protein LOC121534202 isoform X2 [Coregonus clupeaformis]|uniref:uncharacterized protein LOC121534202 isoform X2 n=1 Tax=Coregonus clupeaformis TaxID=59861 RepID=UPI001BDFC1DE|nr:uncharacterized protein LOC121534202 isoform X2 [Coregonus clupeaformis]